MKRKLRCSEMSLNKAVQRKVIHEMKLEGVSNRLIGDPQQEGSLSHNERKRLNFATETLTEPSLLYGEFRAPVLFKHLIR